MTQPSDTPTDHGRQFYCPVHQSSWCRCPVGSGETLEEPLVASHPPPTPEKCDHKFIDSPHCLKCGWVPPTPEEDAITDGEIRRRMKANAADPPAADPGGPMSTDKAPLPEAVREQIDTEAHRIADGDPCILAGSRPGDLVLDPFTGSGTTGAVSVRHQRNFIGCELNPVYIKLARTRIDAVAPLFATEAV